MFGIDITIIAFVGLCALGAGGLFLALTFDKVSNEAKQEKRLKSLNQAPVKKSSAQAVANTRDAAKRRKTVQDSLRELDEKQQKKHKKITLKKTMQQAGMKISIQQFWIYSVIFGVFVAAMVYFSSGKPIVSLCVLVVATFGIPRWFVGFLRKRRFKAFLNEFPNAVDVIVRGVRAGLPLNDCLMIISKEAKEPIRSEFVRLIEAQQMGMTVPQAVEKLYDNVPLPEANFFGIVISIQSSAGGNLSEALSNLSGVLRDRKKMKAKIQAMSAEAKASGGIIGSLPFAVGGLVYLTTPDYISILFTHPTGNVVLLCAAIWMAIGIMVMRQMINFDF